MLVVYNAGMTQNKMAAICTYIHAKHIFLKVTLTTFGGLYFSLRTCVILYIHMWNSHTCMNVHTYVPSVFYILICIYLSSFVLCFYLLLSAFIAGPDDGKLHECRVKKPAELRV